MSNKKASFTNPKTSPDVVPFPPRYNNGSNGGNGDMNKRDDFVTHSELNLTKEKLSHQIDNRFDELDKHITELGRKIDITRSELSGKIDTAKAESNGKINVLNAKVNSTNNIVKWILGIVATVIGGIIVWMLTNK